MTPTPQTGKPPVSVKPKWLLAGIGALALVIAIVVLAPILGGSWVDSIARKKIEEVGKDRFDSTVTVERVSVSLLPPSATMTGIIFRHQGRTDVPPLFQIARMEIRGGLALLAPKPRASSVRLVGLRVVVPRRRGAEGDKPDDEQAQPKQKSGGANFGAVEIIADGANLQVLSKKPGRDPLGFDLERLRLHDVSLDEPMRYDARLTNPKPPGLIHSDGSFGPWNGPEPSLTPLKGQYRFTDADLSHFKGLAGILTSDGKFTGLLERIEVDGKADVPQFALDISGNPVHLETQYHAIVDGTNGDTRLEPVHAQFLNSKIVARGGVEGQEGQKGKTVRLDVDVKEARIEDMLRLALRGKARIIEGPLQFHTQFELPPGPAAAIDRLRLDGKFRIDDGKFQKNKVQDKIDALSRRGQGEPENTAVQNTATDLAGGFSLAGGVIRFQQLSFRVPGAGVRINGSFGLRNESLDFDGTLRLDAKVSETTTGIKSFLLKAVDPLFSRKNKAGSVIPIKISGTRSKPDFGLDVAKAVKPGE